VSESKDVKMESDGDSDEQHVPTFHEALAAFTRSGDI
jgi:hypothetical protein